MQNNDTLLDDLDLVIAETGSPMVEGGTTVWTVPCVTWCPDPTISVTLPGPITITFTDIVD